MNPCPENNKGADKSVPSAYSLFCANGKEEGQGRGTTGPIQFNSFKFSATNYNYKIEIQMLYEYTKIIKLNKVKTILHKIIITI